MAIFNLAIVEERRKNYDKAIDYLKKYLDSDFAKKKNNQEVFALIEKVRSEKEAATGKRASDDDIMKLAAKSKPGPAGSMNSNRDKEFVDADPRIQEGDDSQPAAKTESAASVEAAKAVSNASPKTTIAVDKDDPDRHPAAPAKAAKKVEKKKSYKNDKDEIDDLEKQLK